MLTLRLKSGEYIAIGEDIAVQVFRKNSEQIEVAIKAPREIPIVRGEILERTEERPEGLHKNDYKRQSVVERNARHQRALERRIENRRSAIDNISSSLDEIESTNPELRAKLQSMRRQLSSII